MVKLSWFLFGVAVGVDATVVGVLALVEMSVSGLELTHKDAFWYDLFQSRSVFFSRTTYSGAQLIQVHLFWGPVIPEFLLRNVWDIENDLFWDDLFWDDLFRDVLFRDDLFGWLFTSFVKNGFLNTGIMVFSIIWHCQIVFHCTLENLGCFDLHKFLFTFFLVL